MLGHGVLLKLFLCFHKVIPSEQSFMFIFLTNDFFHTLYVSFSINAFAALNASFTISTL